MTRGQKSLTWIVGLIVAYFIAAFPLKWPPFKRPAATIPVSLFTTAGDCDAKPRLPEIWPKYGDKIYYAADASGPYTVDFGGLSPYTAGSSRIYVPSGQTVGPFTAPVPLSTKTYYYTLSNGSNCKQLSRYIGVIVKP